MEETNKFALYFYAYAGALGLVFLIVTILNYYKTTEFSSNYLLPFWGFILTFSYINYLESRAGISKKIIWIKSISSIIMLLLISKVLFY
ncbi:hypothetical protein [Psychrobacillus psychrotolerans]|uniref:hypothetical protein n=1 Tax=Psychrobacillus psychrotolerans TaxID=126156 RepID=UPI003314C27C